VTLIECLVTIGFCVKDVADTVKIAIESILSQDIPKESMEIIVVEGASKDRTSVLAETCLKQSEVSYRVFRENTGLGTARQIAVDNAIGKYIIWVDGDMILPKNYVRRQVEFMENHPNVGIAGGKYDTHLGNGIVADLENVVYVASSVYGERGASVFGYLPGTEGSIFRLNAIRGIGGFDVRIKGAAEDTEVAYRMKASGWDISITQEVFAESTRPTWVSLWAQYVWYGSGSHFIFHKDQKMINIWKMTPMAGFIAGALRCPGAYLVTHKKIVFMLPIHYVFKRIAWCVGFLKAHFNHYGHFLT
jgi:glycosyltransferase involved in cell wall biosynthesis